MLEAMKTTPTILIVDTEPDVVAATTRACAAPGYDVLQARSGAEGIEIALREIPDVVILGTVLEGEDGIEICRRITAAPTLRSVFVVMACDTRLSSEEAAEVLDAGAVELFERPLHDHELIVRLRMLVRLAETEARLDAAQGFLDTVLDQSPFPMWIGDAEGTIIRTNRALLEALNLSSEQLVGAYNPLRDPNVVRDGLIETVRAVIERQEPARFTMLWRPVEFGGEAFKEGRDCHVDVVMYPIVLNGQVQNIVTQWQDVTDRVLAEARFRDLYEHAPDMYVSVDAKTGLVTQCNQTLLSKTGYSRDEVVGQRIFDRYTPGSLEGAHTAFRQFVDTGEVHDAELRLKRKDGGVIDVSLNVSAVRDDAGTVVRSRSSWRDITEHKAATEALHESEQRLRLAMESASEGFWEWNFTTGLITFDDVALRMLGYDADFPPQLGEWWISQIHAEDRSSIEESFAAFVGGERQTYAVEFRLATRGGAYVWVSLTARIVRWNEQGKPLLVVGIHRDITQAKQTENRLREAEAELRAVLDSTPFPVAVVDSDDHVIRYWSQSARTLFGHTAPTTPEWYEIAYPDPTEREDVIRHWKQALAVARNEGRPVNAGEYEVTCADGSTRLCELHAAFVRDSLVVTFRDVTAQRETEHAQKAAEEALRQSEHRFQLAMDASRDGLFDWNLVTNEIYYSPGWKSMLGYADHELPNDFSVWESTTDPDDVERSWAMQQDLIHGRRDRFEIEFKMKHKDGHWVDILSRANAVFDDDGQAVRFVGTHVDISDLKDAEAALRESEAKYRSLFENSVAPVLNTLPDGTIEAANPACDDLFGAGRGGLVGANILDFYADPADRVAFKRAMDEQGAVRDCPIPFKKKDGTLIHCQASVSAHRSEDGETVVGYRGTLRDVTREQELQKQLTQAQKLESVGRLAGGVAHDFNNMLGVILGHADWILQKSGSDLPYREGLMEIRTAAERSADLTRQLLAFARRQTVSPKVIDLNTTIEDMLKMLRRLIGEDIEMAWIPGGTLWPVKVDPGQIDQIMANLCVNARDAIRGVGKVTIETRNTVFDKDYCRDHAGFKPGEYVMLAVSDNGCGMDAETLSNVFEPFFTTKDLGKGTGLGLATVYGAVKQNSGFINIYSEPGQGTTLKIYLPRHTAAPAPPPTTGRDENRPHGTETVLLVEDEPAILRMTSMMLEQQGYTVLSASSPGEAIRLATEHGGTIHLLVTDVVMPEMNGRDLAELLLSLHPNLKYLFMSGYTANVIVHHDVLNDGVSFIQKPFSSRDLAAKVRQVLDRE
jgi:two-component system cell cycle sensor histidine kinase/response regulator CckA